MNMKKLIVLVLLVIVLAGCGKNKQEEDPYSHEDFLRAQNEFRTYTDENYKISYEYPASWSVKKTSSPADEIEYVLFSKKDNLQLILIRYGIQPKHGDNIDELADFTIEEVSSMFSGFELISSEKIEISGQEAHKITYYLARDNGIYNKHMVVQWFYDNNLYEMRYTQRMTLREESAFEGNMSKVDRTIGSIKLLE